VEQEFKLTKNKTYFICGRDEVSIYRQHTHFKTSPLDHTWGYYLFT